MPGTYEGMTEKRASSMLESFTGHAVASQLETAPSPRRTSAHHPMHLEATRAPDVSPTRKSVLVPLLSAVVSFPRYVCLVLRLSGARKDALMPECGKHPTHYREKMR